jgi:DNA-binding response OmpR family regulator
MATVNRTSSALAAPMAGAARFTTLAAPPHVLRCLVVSTSAERRRLIRAAAEAQAWDAIVCRDAGEFLRVALKRSVPLILVDLPEAEFAGYRELRDAAYRARQCSQSLLLVAGSEGAGEEIWARSLGAWSYLSGTVSQRGFEAALGDARLAIEQTSSRLRSSGVISGCADTS